MRSPSPSPPASPPDIVDLIDQAANEQGITIRAVIENAIRQYSEGTR